MLDEKGHECRSSKPKVKCVVVVVVLLAGRGELFFPASMMIVGAHYLPFAFLLHAAADSPNAKMSQMAEGFGSRMGA